MDDYIKSLRDQCWVEKRWDTENKRWIDRHVDLNKFAVLVAQECLREVWYDCTPKQIADNIRERFGIEE